MMILSKLHLTDQQLLDLRADIREEQRRRRELVVFAQTEVHIKVWLEANGHPFNEGALQSIAADMEGHGHHRFKCLEGALRESCERLGI
jgi:hypothetical protein